MWNVTALLPDGTRRSIQTIEVGTDGPFSSAAALGPALQLPNPHLHDLLREEVKDPQLIFSAIETWAEAAEREAQQFDWAGAPKLKRVEEALAWYATDGGPPECLAWHDRTGVLIPLSGEEVELTIEYLPQRDDEHRARRLLHRHTGASHRVETYFDWRGYFGQKTGIVDGWSSMQRRGSGFVARLKGVGGMLVGTVLRRATLPERTLETDPRRGSRLVEMELKYRHIADRCPSLEDIGIVNHEQALVFVHGTASCGISGLKDIFWSPAGSFQVLGAVYRFEHDTFIPVIENAKQLAGLVQTRVQARRLMLAAHSRGGLVAVEAARYLADAHYAGKVEVQTFGTPFRGTPLVAIGQKVVNLLMKLGEELATAVPVPVMSALAKGIFYLVEAPKLPAGIATMHEQAPELPYREQLIDAGRLQAWGSDYDIESGSAGFGATVEGMLLGAMGRHRHDLVVPLASALAYGGVQPVLRCSHVQYFRQAEVRAVLTSFLSPAPAALAVAPAPTAAAPAGPTAQEMLKASSQAWKDVAAKNKPG